MSEIARETIPRRHAQRRRGLAARLTWAFVLLAGALLLIVGLMLILISYNAQVEQLVVRQQKTADEAVLVISAYLAQAQNALSAYGQGSSLKALFLRSMEFQQEELSSVLSKYGDLFEELTLLDAEGNELAKVSHFHTFLSEELGSQEASPAFQQALQGEAYAAEEIHISPYSSLPVITVAVPLQGRERQGVLIAETSVKGMWDAMAQVEVGETGYAYLVNRHTGRLIAHPDLSRYLSFEKQSLEQVPIVQQLMADRSEVDHQYRGMEGESVVGAAAPLPDTSWVLIAELPTKEALAGVRQMLYMLAVLIIVGLVAAGSLGLIIPRRVVRPLLALQEGAQEIGAGHLDHVIQVRTGDEIQNLAESFNQMAASLKASRTEIERWGHELEIRVEERTRELTEASEQTGRRAIQLQASADVARTIASVRDLDHLLPQVTQLISERFGWYHVGIFLTDRNNKYAVLRAANSEGGQHMIARGHKLRVGKMGIVGYVTAAGQPRIALDVGEDAVYFDTPELHGTRSEMALPLKMGERIIGALDVQSTEASAYDDEDVALLSTLADQVAIAIENTRLFEQTRRALEEVRTLHRQYLQREWAKETRGQRDLVYEYRRPGTLPRDDSLLPEMAPALAEGEVVALSSPADSLPEDDGGNGRARAVLAAPIKLRDQVIGVLDLEEADELRRWTADEIALVEAVSDQVALALENARLFADAQRRAEQLGTLNRIGLTLTSGLELERVLQTLYEQCQQALVMDTFYVALYDEATGLIEFPLLTGADGLLQIEPQDIHERPGLAAHIIQSGQPLYVPDMQAKSEDAPYRALPITAVPARSYLGVPLIAREQVMGVLSIQSYEPNAYGDEDLELLTTMATQAAIAIENARAYKRLVETADQLREIDRLKTQFLANMSHELRTPLNSIIGFSRVMLKGIDGPLTDLQESDLTSIYNSGQHLLSLINSILDMSKIEAGKMDLSFDEVLLPDVFGAVVSTARALVKDRPVELRSEVPDDLPTVWADAQRVRQILINLMSNATKFTEQGHITLRAEAGPEFVTISVSDTGVGIEPEAQSRLFIPFQQVDASTTRRAGGTGLGLAISHRFVQMHGGEIWMESEPGKGSTFFFTLPVYQVVRKKEGGEAEISLDPDKKAVLAIDDDAGVLTLLNRYLEHDGYQVIGVMRPYNALEMARHLASKLTAITLDVVMPHMDGWQVLRALKEDPQTKDIPVILCSIVEGLEQGLDLGAAAYLHKPATRDEVLDALKKVEYQAAGTI